MVLVCRICSRLDGKVEAIEVKIRSDIPLPTPRSVMSSPIHMINPVPAVMVMTISEIASGSVFTKIGRVQSAPNSAPCLATVTKVVDCNRARAMVR
jgi:hypothetical protein